MEAAKAIELIIISISILAIIVCSTVIYWIAIGYLCIAVFHGNSMYPTIKDGQIGICFKTNDYQVGDIVVFNSTWSDKLICHRIIYKADGVYITKGDNNYFPDPPITEDNIKCEMIWWF